MFNNLKDKIQGKVVKGKKRSGKWRYRRRKHLKKFPRCAVCESKKKLEVHHIIPFSVDPSLELEDSNLVTLCENKKYGCNCHLLIGHLGNYQRTNLTCLQDIDTWHKKIKGDKDDKYL